MKFGKRFEEEMVAEWMEFYVSYKKLKDAIVAATTKVAQQKRKATLAALAEDPDGDGTTVPVASPKDDPWDVVVATTSSELERASKHFLKVLLALQKGIEVLLRRLDDAMTAEGHGPTDRPSMAPLIDETSPTVRGYGATGFTTTPKMPAGAAAPVGGSAVDDASFGSGESPVAPMLDDPVKAAKTGAKEALVAGGATVAELGSSASGHGVPGSTGLSFGTAADNGSDASDEQTGLLSSVAFGKANRNDGAPEDEKLRRLYLRWFYAARVIGRFAEINVKAVEKAAKKARKSGGDACAAEMEILAMRSVLATHLPRIARTTETLSNHFERYSSRTLEQFKDVVMEDAASQWHAKWRFVFAAACVFFFLLWLPSELLDSHIEARRCLAIFGFCLVMWVTEAIPYFCTSLMIPILAVPMGVLLPEGCNNDAECKGHLLVPREMAEEILSVCFDYKSFLIIGGLTIAKGLAKAHLELRAAYFLHRYTAHRPQMYMLGMMLGGCLLSAFVSNQAAAILSLSVVQPTLWALPRDSGAPQALLLGMAFACNFGGMLSPIASSQNAVAASLHAFRVVSFPRWFFTALPMALIGVLGSWALLLWKWQPFANVPYIPEQLVHYRAGTGGHGVDPKRNANAVHNPTGPLTRDAWVVLIVTLLTIALWCVPGLTGDYFGDVGVVSLIPVVIFFGVGILKKDDFSSLPWHLIFLVAGGNMLARCATRSGFLDLANTIAKPLTAGLSPTEMLIGCVLAMSVINLFIKHTVSALVFLPFLAKLGHTVIVEWHNKHSHHDPNHTSNADIIMAATLMISGSMCLPVSSFPNMNSALAEDAAGEPYLKGQDYIVPGVTLSAGVAAVLCSVYSVMLPYCHLGSPKQEYLEALAASSPAPPHITGHHLHH